MKTIAVIGAGTMGNGIAHVFAQQNYTVHLIDLSKKALALAITTIESNLERQITRGLCNELEKENTIQNIHVFTSLSEGVAHANLVIEAVTENETIKLDLFKQLDILCAKETILASNTSSISITKIAAATTRPNQVIGVHFMNPVPLMPLVEVIKGYSTSEETTSQVMNIIKCLHKTAVVVNDYPGFVANRILMPMINEAIETLQNGVAGVAEIDAIMKLGMAHPMGPLQLADFIGLDVCLSILNVLYDGFKTPKYAPTILLVNMVQAGKLGVKSGEGFYDYSVSRKAEMVSGRFI